MEYTPTSLEECFYTLEDQINDLDDAIANHGEQSLDAKDAFRSVKWVLDGAVKAGYIDNNIAVEIPWNESTKTIVWHNTFGNYEYADAVYWALKEKLDGSNVA